MGISYSKTKKCFLNDVALLIQSQASYSLNGTKYFSDEDIRKLPEPIQKYFVYCGWLGTPKMDYMKMTLKNVPFSLGRNKRTIKINYTQYNAAHTPDRIAYIESALFGIPFEGKDTFIHGTGSMKGVLAKLFTIFNQKGAEMDQACLVTYLSETLLIPNAALQPFITWHYLDEHHVQATIFYKGIHATGIFTFNDEGRLESFTTSDREAVSMNGEKEKVNWTVYFKNYKTNHIGVKTPMKLQAIWNYPEGDLLYFDGDHAVIEYDL